MHTIQRFLLGILSSALFAVGFARAADRLDPVNDNSATGMTVVSKSAPDSATETWISGRSAPDSGIDTWIQER